MKNRAELIATFIIGYLVLLSICVLFYFIFATSVELKFFSEKFDQATIITNLLIWSATLYAPVVAYMAFDNWREQTNKQMLANEAKELWKSTKELEKQFLSIDDYYSTNPEYIEYNNSKYYKHVHKCDKDASDLHIELFYFSELSKKNNYDLFLDSFEVLKLYREIINSNKYKYEKDIYEVEKDEREKYIQQIEKIKEHLLSFIHV